MATVLLVEDNEMNRDMLSRRLRRKGYGVICAVNGQQAVDLAAAETPALILMDMSLPVLDGWEATRKIKASNPRLPIIALTAHAMEGDERKAREAGCDDYDTKPIELERLTGKIERLLKNGQGTCEPSLAAIATQDAIRAAVNRGEGIFRQSS